MKFETKYSFSDYKGKQIFYLTPISESTEKGKDSSILWNFRCCCGKVVTLAPYRVISGHTKSCGCMRYVRDNKEKPKTPKQHKKRIDPEKYIGLKSNKLTVVDVIIPSGHGRVKLKCSCDCGSGKDVILLPYQFDSGKVQSCGCARFGHSECHKGNTSRRTHNMTNNKFYKVWNDMVRRCYNPQEPSYKNYGARGITVCDEWKYTPTSFISWCESTYPNDGIKYSIDRIDVNGNYCPENCHWATSIEQMQNTRCNRNITLFGETKCVTQWGRDLNISVQNIYRKVNNGMTFEDAILSTLEYKKKFQE